LIVEAAEDLFVPVLVYNNKKGDDEKLLKHFNEPSWNNPVIRYLNDKEEDLTPRKELVLTVPETASRMLGSLQRAGRDTPAWLEGLSIPTRARQMEQATFSMY
jgi:hypothetical protein